MPELLLIALALSLDAFAVSVSEGTRSPSKRHALQIVLLFGGFQALMPVIGYMLGHALLVYIAKYSHFVAMGLLCYIGIRMIIGAAGNVKTRPACSNLSTLFLLAIATSIDALAVGIGLAIARVNIFLCALVIGAVTIVLCVLGVKLGSHLGGMLQKRAEIIGGLILIILGIKLLLEHVYV